MFAQIIELYEHVTRHLQASLERLAFFFTQKEGMNWCCAHLLLMDKLYKQSEDIHQLLQEEQQTDKAEWTNQYARLLISYETDDNDESSPSRISNEHELFHLIDAIDVDTDRKWLYMQVYQNYETYWSE